MPIPVLNVITSANFTLYAAEHAKAAQEDDPTPQDGLLAVFLHGFGANEQDLVGLAAALPPQSAWISLRAPIELQTGSYAWFPIVTPGSPDPDTVTLATESIWTWLDAHIARHTHITPIGFSQGGLMASELLRTRPEQVRRPAILSGFVQGEHRSGDGALHSRRPAVFWGRGSDDRVIAPAAIARTSTWLPEHSTLTERIYPGLAHGISTAELQDLSRFLAIGA